MRRTTALLSAGALALATALIAGPASAAEGDLTLNKASVTLGADVTVTATLKGCNPTDAALGIELYAADAEDGDDPIAVAEGLEVNEDGVLIGTLTVPADAEAGDATVYAYCAVDEDATEGNDDEATLTLVAAETTTDEGTPEETTPVAKPAAPVVAQPTFTG